MAQLSGGGPPLTRLCTDGSAHLEQCTQCRAYWEVNLREAHVISEAEARADWSAAFPAPPA